MDDEFFDIVDENNNLTGTKKSRQDVHSSGLWHRVVHIYFFRENNKRIEFLVHLRAKTKDLAPNKWDTRFGGHIKAGQAIEQTVVDEIKQEVNLDIELSDLIKGKIQKQNKYPNREFAYIYYFRFNGDIHLLNFKDEEVQKVKWMPIDKIKKSMKDEPENWAGNLKDFHEISSFITHYSLHIT